MQSLYQRIITRASAFGRTHHGWLAAVLLATMFGLSLGAMIGDSAIVDEVAHIPAGYSYLHYGDMRLNPEHPPLIKDLAGLPLQFMNLKFPVNQVSWTTDVNGQWEAGWNFIYHIGNDPETVLFWSRLPILLLAIAFGVVLYRFAQRRWGRAVALLVLLFYALSPNFLAHSHYVTTDVGASVFMFLALVAFVRFIERPTWQQVLLLSLALAGANLAKFNGALLYPLLGLMALVVAWLWREPVGWFNRAKCYVGRYLLACVGSLAWIWLFYIPHVINMPASVQDRLITGSLVSDLTISVGNILKSMNDVSLLKPLVQYLLGLTMVYGRVSGGNVTYFNGEVRNSAFLGYFPELFVVKTQVAFLILGLIALGIVLVLYWRRRPFRWWPPLADSLRRHLLEWTLGMFAAFYFAVSVAGNLNLGVRHILPIYVPLFVLVAIATVWLTRRLSRTRWQAWSGGALAVLLAWYVVNAVAVYPSFTAYFNELIGGPAQSHRYFSDSSVDWGQDLKRLKQYLDAHPEIDEIALDYFGGGDPKAMFCERAHDTQMRLIATSAGYDCRDSRIVVWHSENGPYTGKYIAVSETYLENDRFYATIKGERGYQQLRESEPIAKIGYSIFVYKLY